MSVLVVGAYRRFETGEQLQQGISGWMVIRSKLIKVPALFGPEFISTLRNAITKDWLTPD